jgi:hypothetical protein
MSNSGYKKKNSKFVSSVFRSSSQTYRHLLAQEIEVFFAVAQTLLSGAELVCEELFGFGDWVGEHDVGLRVIISNFSCGGCV